MADEKEVDLTMYLVNGAASREVRIVAMLDNLWLEFQRLVGGPFQYFPHRPTGRGDIDVIVNEGGLHMYPPSTAIVDLLERLGFMTESTYPPYVTYGPVVFVGRDADGECCSLPADVLAMLRAN